jgi:hypothetical protein
MHIVRNDTFDATGTFLQGKITTNQEALRFAFGPPTYLDGDKTTTEWCVEIDGVLCTIYDWKQEDTPWGDYAWHIGGHSYKSVEAVESVLNICVGDFV